MKRLLAIAAAAALMAGTAYAQTKQTGVLGASGDAIYTLRVQASNGAVYNCKPDIRSIDGVPSRECIRERDDSSVFDAGDGLASGGAVAAGALFFVAVASGSGGGGVSTTVGTP